VYKPRKKEMKFILKSKTAAAALVTALAGVATVFIPEAKDFVASNMAFILIGLGGLNFLLRLVTKDKVSLFPSA